MSEPHNPVAVGSMEPVSARNAALAGLDAVSDRRANRSFSDWAQSEPGSVPLLGAVVSPSRLAGAPARHAGKGDPAGAVERMLGSGCVEAVCRARGSVGAGSIRTRAGRCGRCPAKLLSARVEAGHPDRVLGGWVPLPAGIDPSGSARSGRGRGRRRITGCSGTHPSKGMIGVWFHPERGEQAETEGVHPSGCSRVGVVHPAGVVGCGHVCWFVRRAGRLALGLVAGAAALLMQTSGLAGVTSPEVESGMFSAVIRGELKRYELSATGGIRQTNLFAVSGLYNAGRFVVDVEPVWGDIENQESAGWNGQNLYLIVRYPEEPGRGWPRTNSLGYIEPVIFSREADHQTAGLLMALATLDAAGQLTNADGTPIIMSYKRVYPEEQSRYTVEYNRFGDWFASALCPGYSVDQDGKLIPLEAPAYSNGFLRWRFESRIQHQTERGLITHFKYERFCAKEKREQPTGPTDVSPTVRVEGRIELEFAPVSVQDFRPQIRESPLTVLDFRGRKEYVRASGGYSKDYLVRCVVTNRSWDEAEVEGLKGVKLVAWAVEAMSERRRRYERYRWAFYAVAGVTFAVPLVVAVLQWRKRGAGQA